MPGRKYEPATGYRYGFNGKEKDKDISSDDYDFGARIYDGRIARWLSVDPLQKKYPDLSAYVFSGNRPTQFVDFDGMDFGIKIDHDTKTIIIVANVYTISEKTYNQALKSAAAWNAKSTTIDGYKVSFQVTVKKHENSPATSDEAILKAYPELKGKRGKIDKEGLERKRNELQSSIEYSKASHDPIGNLYSGEFGDDSRAVTGDEFAGGYTANGKSISMNTHDEYGGMGSFEDLVTHEIGHLLGLDDKGGEFYSDDGIMVYQGFDLKPISDNDVKKIINFAKNSLENKNAVTDANVVVIEQKGKSDGSNPLGLKKE